MGPLLAPSQSPRLPRFGEEERDPIESIDLFRGISALSLHHLAHAFIPLPRHDARRFLLPSLSAATAASRQAQRPRLGRARCAGKPAAHTHAVSCRRASSLWFPDRLCFDPCVHVFSSEEVAAAEGSGAPGSSPKPPGGAGSGGCEVGSRPHDSEGDGRTAVQVTVTPMPPPPAPDTSAAPEARAENLAAPTAPEARAGSVTASAAPEVRAESVAASAASEVRAESVTASAAPEVRAASATPSAAPEVRVENLPATAPAHPQPGPRPRRRWWSGIPWTRLVLGGLLVAAVGYAFYKWGLPLLSDKVLRPPHPSLLLLY